VKKKVSDAVDAPSMSELPEEDGHIGELFHDGGLVPLEFLYNDFWKYIHKESLRKRLFDLDLLAFLYAMSRNARNYGDE
jgi:hypothetical protein